MRVYIILSLLVVVYSAKVKNTSPKFTFLEERSANGAPSVSVTFPNGHQDKLVLNRYDANDEDRMANEEHCNFIGHLENEPEACVAMTGCFGSEDVHLTILSAHATESRMFTWTKEGQVEVIDKKDGLHGARREPLVVPRNEDEVLEGDEVILAAEEAALEAAEADCASGSCALPATQKLQIRVGYADGILGELGSKAKVKAYIASIWTHLQVNYCHSSLGSKVVVERLPKIKHYPVGELKADSASLKKMYETTENKLKSADLMLYMGFIGPNYTSGGGIAYVAVVCDAPWAKKYKQSINNYGTSHSAMGELLAHEIGHNLGMSHDFATKHGGDGNSGSGGPCDGEGFMSYGNHKSQWSACSVKDFTAWYMTRKDNWCMPAAESACSNITPPAKTCKEVGGVDNWVGDDYCDDENNNAECKFDGGDCCNNSKPGWNTYCKECKCLSASG